MGGRARVVREPVKRPGRPAWFYMPLGAVLVSNGLGIADVITEGAMFAIDAAAVAYLVGRGHEAGVSAERARLDLVEATEGYIAHATRALDDGDVPDDEREEVEARIEDAMSMLRFADRAAPLSVKLKHKLSRRRE
jgi:hypothetical protein